MQVNYDEAGNAIKSGGAALVRGAERIGDAYLQYEQHREISHGAAAFAQLNDDQRAVVGLVLVEGLAYQEAADVLGIPVGTLTSRLARAREALQRLLGEAPAPAPAGDIA